MTKFVYTAEKSDGEVYKGTAEAADRFELYSIVRHEGGKIVSVNEDAGSNKWNIAYWNGKFSSVKEYDKILMARNLGAMLGAGLSLSRALAVLERQTKNPKLSTTIGEVAGDVRRGESLHAALAKFPKIFPNIFVAMVRAGEEGGDLPSALKLVSEQMERMYDLKKKIKGAMIYPCIILVAIFGIGIVMMIVVVPTLAQTFAEMQTSLPKATQFVIGVSNFLVQYTVVALALIVVCIGAIYGALKTWWGKRAVDFTLLHVPVIGQMVREVNAARTSRTLASLISSGVDVISALDIVYEVVQNSFFRTVVESAKVAVGQGEPLSAAFARREDLYPAFVGEMMAVGEETGQTAEMLKRLAVYYEEEVDRKTKDMSTIIEPFLMLLIGGAVGFFAYAMITPIYSLSQAIN
ncbi:MAG TPA: type II secretion system F family protein [Candidatus Paceibacterota bacterium]|jgi:type IV pilus assembly protein PilC|nr:type II secretion system F family protein [Candidatus Paceibacterota bacterium]